MTDTGRFALGSLLFFFVIVLPVLGYLKLRRVSDLRIVLSIPAIWLLWNIVNAPIHEGGHILAGRLVGMHEWDYQLLPHFWRGDFVHGYARWDQANVQRMPMSTAGPYVADCLIVLLALWLCPRQCSNPFLGALIFVMTYLRSLFDIAVNYAANTLFGGKVDFNFLLRSYPRVAVHTGAVLAILLGVLASARELVRTRRFRDKLGSCRTVIAPAKRRAPQWVYAQSVVALVRLKTAGSDALHQEVQFFVRLLPVHAGPQNTRHV